MKKILHISLALLMPIIWLNAQTLRTHEFISENSNKDSTVVLLFADGNLKGLVANSIQESTGITGALGISVIRKKTMWNGFINIASTIDTLKENYGTIILNPASGKTFTSGLVEVFWKPKKKSWHFYLSASSSYWQNKEIVKSATVIGIGGLITFEILNGKVGENELYFGFETGVSYRGISGNATFNSEEYKEMLGTSGRHFVGPEGALIIRFNHITAGLNIYWLQDLEKNKKIDGISSVQLTGGIKISGAFFKGTIRKK